MRGANRVIAAWIIGFTLYSGTTMAADSEEAAKTIVVSAEGLADPSADTYQRDQGLLLDDLRKDARRQAIEKAVGTFVESSTLVENYALVRDQILTKSQGLIKQEVKWSDPWKGQDGFMHVLLKAEVYLGKVGDALKQMSQTERKALIKEYGNPKVSVNITYRDADRGANTPAERSQAAEAVISAALQTFGYRVWSEDIAQTLKTEAIQQAQIEGQATTTISISQEKASDFSISGEVKFKRNTGTIGGVTLTTVTPTSMTLRCVNNHTGEAYDRDPTIPKAKGYNSEDEAMKAVGEAMAKEFPQSFFEDRIHLANRVYQMHVYGLPDYDTGTLLKKELLGLRSVLNVDFRDFSADGVSHYEVEFAGQRGNFGDFMNNVVVTPLNRKLGEKAFRLTSAQGEVVKLAFASAAGPEVLSAKFNGSPPASLADSTPERLQDLVKDKTTMHKVAAMNPEAVKKMADSGDPVASDALKAAKDF